MLYPQHQVRLRIRFFHRQLQPPQRGSGRAHELSRKVTLGTLHAWVRSHIRSPRDGSEDLMPAGVSSLSTESG